MKLTGLGKMVDRAKGVRKKLLPKVMPGENVLRLSVNTRMLLIPRRKLSLENALSVRGLISPTGVENSAMIEKDSTEQTL